MVGFFSNLMGSFKVDIRCDLSRNVFFPGNIVEGVVIVQARSPIDFRAIRLKLAGKQRVTITRTHTTTETINGRTESRTHKTYHTETNVLYKQLVTLAGNMKYGGYGNGSSTYHMPQGVFYYPFSVQLPNDLPPSMSHRAGHSSEIYFYAKAYCDIPMGRDAVSKSMFSVLRPMPIAQWQQKMPVQDERQFHVTCCCCIDKGYVKARLFMDRTVIAIDRDDIHVYADVDNTLGKEPVKSLIVNLRAVINSRARGERETKAWNQSQAIIANHIPAGEKGILQGVIRLRRNATPTFTTPLTSMSYSLHAELEIPMASNPSVSFPVVVAQSVDESNYTAPIQFGNAGAYRVHPKGAPCPEFYYVPPQRPVFEVNVIPCMPPPPPQFFMPPPTIATVGVPSSEWAREAAPFTPEGVTLQTNAGGISFQAGYDQPVMRVTAATKEQPPLIGGAAPQTPAQEDADGKGYGSIATPLM